MKSLTLNTNLKGGTAQQQSGWARKQVSILTWPFPYFTEVQGGERQAGLWKRSVGSNDRQL